MPEYLPRPLPRLPRSGPNPATQRAHRHQVFWQIIFPLLLGLLLIGGLIYWLIVAGVGGTERWAEISLVFILLPILVLSWVPLALILVLIIGINRLHGIIPPYTRWAQDIVARLGARLRAGADLAAEPLLQANRLAAMVRRLLNREERL